jgi:threonine dehydratase
MRLRREAILRAREVVGRHLQPTPLRPCLAVSGANAWSKLECWQPTGSFKVRGALNAMAALSPDERRAGLVTASAGNHGLGVALAAEILGIREEVTVYVPETVPRAKLIRLRRFPVTVVERGGWYDEAAEAAHEHERSRGARFVHAFEDPAIAAGQGTVGLEILEQAPQLARVLVPVGGGGLLAGIAVAIKAVRPDVRVIAVQPSASPALRESLRLGRPLLEYPAGPTLADGVAGGIGHVAFEHRDLVDDVVVVEEEEIADAIIALLTHDQVVAEGSGALGVAALRSGRVSGAGDGMSVVVVTGGNVDADVLRRLLGEA